MHKQDSTNAPCWLIVSYYANVNGRAASHHVDDRLAAFRAAGINVTVLSSVLGPRYEHEQQLRVFSLLPVAILDELKAAQKRNNHHAFPVSFIRLMLQVLAAIPIALLSILQRLFLHRDKRWSWQFTAALRGWWWSRTHRPDLILTTGGPASAHVAGSWLAERLGVPLICEFQDPLPFQYPPTNQVIHDYHLELEVELGRKANALVYLTEGAVDAASERLLSLQQQASVAALFAVTSGAPTKVVPEKVQKQRRVLAHIGTLSGTRNLNAILQALAALSTKDALLHQRFSIQLAGTLDKAVLRSIESFALNSQIETLGRQPREALDAVIENADILLLIQNTGPIAQQTIPSKAFEYLQTGRPILGLIDGNTQLRSILQEHGHTVYDLNDDVAELEKQLGTLLTDPLPEIKACRLTVQYSVDNLIHKIKSVL